jgi:positive regulator of sigma E activity
LNEPNLIETGRVVARRDGALEVAIASGDSCAKCGLCRRAQDNSMRVDVKDDPSIQIGQSVRVILPYASQWRAIFFVFVLPLILFFGGAFAAVAVSSFFGFPGAVRVLLTLVAAFGAMAGGFFAARSADRRFRKSLFEKTRLEPLDNP